MAHDLVIRGGRVVDGTGAEPVAADVAIDGSRITSIGALDAPGRREIDARGHVVTPGFVDIHTHLDAQIGWDPLLTPLSWHGVTTALLGNCGVTFAPCRDGDRERLAGMMETVEDIPADAILNGLSWNWEDYGGYLDALEALAPAINVAGLVGHCAVRFFVMGDRAVGKQATDAERDEMAEVVGRALDAGAVGFSTSRFPGHFLPDGRHVPGTHAEHGELIRIAEAVAAHGGGLMQNVLNLGGEFESEMDLLRKQAQTTGDRVLFSIAAGHSDDSGRRMNERIDGLCAQGLDVSAVSIPRGSGLVTGLVHLMPWRGASWRALARLDFAGRLRALDDPETCAALLADAQTVEQRFATDQIFPLGEGAPDYDFRPEQSLQARAEAAGEHPAETFLRISRETRGRALFTVRFFNANTRALRDLITGDHVLPGLGDAGAHVGQIMDSGWCSFVLSHWVRETHLYSLPEAIRRMTSAPARIMGLEDRGRLASGLRADVNVIDLDRVREEMPEYVHDFPGGAGRFIQRAVGYRATICNGQQILADDKHTGARPGQVLRG
ncbi:MAG: amidohydrolase family protein [Myxococcota bacterium]